MRVPPREAEGREASVRMVRIEKPIIIPRLPVITTERQRVKLVKTIEKYCRQAIEYSDLITYLKQHMDMDQCTFLNDFKANKKRGIIEIHHAPYTLFSIVDVVMRKQQDQMGYIDEFKVVEEVLRIHYNGLIGLIPLSVTCHQLVHDDKLPVPLWCVYGRFVEFTKRYYDWIPDPMLEELEKQMQLSRKYRTDPKAFQEATKILSVQYVYLDVEGEMPMEDGIDSSVLSQVV